MVDEGPAERDGTQRSAHPLRYRVWAGFALWIGGAVLDLLFLRSGALSLLGFLLAVAWSMLGPETRKAPRVCDCGHPEGDHREYDGSFGDNPSPRFYCTRCSCIDPAYEGELE